MRNHASRNHLRWLALWALCGGWLLGSCQRQAQPLGPSSSLRQPIINGKVDLRYPAIGAMVDGGGGPFCTGTLISSRIVLTAAHCVDGRTQGRLLFRIDLPSTNSDGFTPTFYEFDNQYIATHPEWNGNLAQARDIAIAVLKKPVPSSVTTPIPFNTDPLTNAWIGKDVTFLGYGLIQSVPTSVSPKTKYGGVIPIVQIFKEIFMVHGQGGVNICHGDSGGPGLAMINGRLTILGVNSFSTSAKVPGSNPSRTSCDKPSGIARTDPYARFIQSWVDRFGDPPASCTQDQDCTRCERCDTTAGKNTCQRKPDLRNAAYCRPCKTDADCGDNRVCHRFDEGFRCVQPCPRDGCCPDGASCAQMRPTSGTTQGWYCVPNGRTCPPVSCQTAQDCGPGELCQSGTCAPTRPARAPKLCFPCSTHADCNDATTQGRLCLGPAGQGFCTQLCGQSDFCPNGLTCDQPYRGVPKQCTPQSNTCRIDCTTDAECPTGFVCQSRVCSRKGGGIQGDLCDPMPCSAGLLCIPTASGKRCMRPCGAPPGSPGGPCLPDETCIGKALCQSVTTTSNACILPCKTSADCLGAPCNGGICKCAKDSDCNQDAYCNDDAKYIPACVLRKDRGTCDKGWQCTPHAGYNVCVADGPGHVALGQVCDAINRCRKGLVCVLGKDGRRCMEDCTLSRSCQLGGFCSAEKDGVAVCVCRNDSSCTNGRTCSPLFYQDQFGYCIGAANATQCIDSSECPASTICEKGNCVPAPPPEPMPEPTPEPAKEPVTPDEPTQEPAKEPTPEPQPDAGPSPEPAPEPAKEATKEPSKEPASPADTAKEGPPSSGCQCQSTPHPTPPLSALLCLLFCLTLRRRRQ